MAPADFEGDTIGANSAPDRQGANFYGTLPKCPEPASCSTRSASQPHPNRPPFGNWAARKKSDGQASISQRSGHHLQAATSTNMEPGDVLVDDRENHRAAYESAGVVFVHHKDAEDSLRQLAKIFPSVKAGG